MAGHAGVAGRLQLSRPTRRSRTCRRFSFAAHPAAGLHRWPARRHPRQRPHAHARCAVRPGCAGGVGQSVVPHADLPQPLHAGDGIAPGSARHRAQRPRGLDAGPIRVQEGVGAGRQVLGRRTHLGGRAPCRIEDGHDVLARFGSGDRGYAPGPLAAVRRQADARPARGRSAGVAGSSGGRTPAVHHPVHGTVRRRRACGGNFLAPGHGGHGDHRRRAGEAAGRTGCARSSRRHQPDRAVRPRHGGRTHLGHGLS